MICPACSGRGSWVAFGVLPAMPGKVFLLNIHCGICRGAGRVTVRKANEWKARKVLNGTPNQSKH